MAQYKNGQYWREEQDYDMRIMLTTDSNTKEWLHAYRRTLPRLKKMGESILRRYFMCPESEVQNMITDAITVLITKGNYNPEKPKMYAYCGTILKRHFYTELVTKKVTNNIDNNIDRNYDITTDEWLIDKQAVQPNDEFDMPERMEQYLAILKIIDDGIAECDAILSRNNKRDYEPEIGSIREKAFLIKAKEYFTEFFMTGRVSILSLADYISGRVDIPQFVISRYLQRYFNIGSQPVRIDDRTVIVNWVERRGVSSYMMDDDCPSDVHVTRSKRQRNKNKLTGFEYF